MGASEDSARPWKIATAALAVACVALGVLVLLQQTTPPGIELAGAVGGTKPAEVKLRQVQGDDALSPRLRKQLEAAMQAAGKMTYSAAGVASVAVDGTVTDSTKSDDKGHHVAIKVSLMVTKQPGNRILGAYSGTAAITLEKETPADEVTAYKGDALDAAAEGVFADVKDLFEDR